MRYRSLHITLSLAVVFIALPLLASPQEPPPTEKQPPQDQAPKARLDLYGDPLPEGAVARIGTTKLRHSGMVTSLAYSTDGRTISVATADRRIRVWDPKVGKQIGQLAGPYDRVTFSEDGSAFASTK